MDMYNSSFRYENYLRNSPESMLNNQNQRQIGQCPSSPGRVFNSNGVQQSSQNMSMTNQSLSFRNFESNCSYDIAGNSVFHQNNSSHFARPINKISKMKNQPRQNQEIQEQTQNSSSIMASCSSSYTKSPQIDPNFQRFNTTRRGAKVYICEVCDKQFIRPSSLSTHRLSHTGEKPHSCSTCGKSFSVASNLRRHEV
ncbi:hypothetical protein BY996DRAFT_2014757 [Phakopsora pachyrhizi]|nr:hypothetical protein BY996DRAFT_2014757 [Phakopsora pachyrhizi]